MLTRLVEKAFAALPDSKFRRWVVLDLRCKAVPPEPENKLNLTISELAPSRFELLGLVNPQLDEACLSERHAAGNRCFLSELDGIPVFYQWVFVNNTPVRIHLNTRTDMHVDLVLSPGWAYQWDTWTREENRGLGIQPCATRHMYKYLFEKGCRGLVTLVNTNNRPSLRALSKNNFAKRTTLTHVRCFGVDLVLSRYVHGGDSNP